MIIVSLNDFSNNQSKYLSLAQTGENILLKAKDGLFRIMPFQECDGRMDAFMIDIKAAMQEVKDDLSGKRPLNNINSLWEEL